MTMMKIKWGFFQKSSPFICTNCGHFLWEMRKICESCGSENTLRKTTKKDYKIEMEKRKTRNT